ncbi:MAG: Ig-like domain-containing protein [Spirochaetota bacterium]|nr:Ig-like domain-containing protein [Spirochaetota bacterium]
MIGFQYFSSIVSRSKRSCISYRLLIAFNILLLCLWGITACTDDNGGSNPPADTTPPTVSSTSPADSATDVAVNSVITATFSEAMDDSSITSSSFIVTENGSDVSGTVTYNASTRTATLSPSADLLYETPYTATITTDVKDEAGNNMASNYEWNFTTGIIPDETPPEVSSTSPDNGEIDVYVNTLITVTFNEDMNSATITTATFTLHDGSTPVSGVVSYDVATKTATFDPDDYLDATTLYTAKVLAAVEDLAFNPMGSDYEWSFTTGVPRVRITWEANREKAVNSAGGGYKVYYSQTNDFDISGASSIDVPWVSGQTPTSITIPLTSLSSGTWYIKVVAYSALGGGSVSEPSTQSSIVVP